MTCSPRRPAAWLATVVAGAALVLLAAPAAHADDIFEIDERLADAGFELAYTEAYGAADRSGVRVVVDYDSDSTDAEAYRGESEEIARLVWLNLDGEVLAVDVAPTYDVSWAPDGLPPAISFDRAALTDSFGARPAALDEAQVETFEDFEEAGLAIAVVGVGLWAASVVVPAVVVFFVTRARYRRPAAWQQPPWSGAPGPWGPTPGGWAPAWPQPAAPAAWPPPPPPPAGAWSPTAPAQGDRGQWQPLG